MCGFHSHSFNFVRTINFLLQPQPLTAESTANYYGQQA